jgi:LPXTG-motif cell wall-anchored protein
MLSTMVLMSVGWQLGMTTPASADQQDEPAVGQTQVLDDEASKTKIGPTSDQATATTDDDEDETGGAQVQLTTALTPDTEADQPAIARTAEQVMTPPVVAGEQPDQVGTSTDESAVAVVPTGIPVSTEPTPDQSVPVMAYDDRTIDEWMPNPRLQKAILRTLQIGDRDQVDPHPDRTWKKVTDITQQDMSLLRDVSIIGSYHSDGISTYIDGKTEFSLEGLEYATNLESIAMGGGERNYAPFQMHGDVVDISPLAYLSKLKKINLRNNRIEDISPIQNVSKLTLLLLDYNHIVDFSPLKDLKSNAETRFDMQYAILPPIRVDAQTRKYHMFSPVKLANGETVNLMRIQDDACLEEGEFLRQNVRYNIVEEDYHTYYQTLLRENIVVANDRNDLWFQNIPDQHLGVNDPDDDYLVVSPDQYYLVAEADISKKQVEGIDLEGNPREGWYVIQPYTIAQAAGPITIHYQDQSGKTIAQDQKLPQGFVDDDYNAEELAVKIKGYTLQTPLPENTKGKYTADPITIKFVYQQDQSKPTPSKPPVAGVTPPVAPGVVPPATPDPKPTVPTPVTPPTVTKPAEPNQSATPTATVESTPTAYQAGTASVVAPVTPVNHAGVSDAIAATPAPQLPRRLASFDFQSSSQRPLLPRTGQHKNQLAWYGGWGLLLGVVGLVWRHRKRE